MTEAAAIEPRPALGEQTKRQGTPARAGGAGVLSAFDGLALAPAGTYATYREMLEDPTIALARMIVRAPIEAGEWTIEAKDGTPDDRVKFIQDQLAEARPLIVAEALRSLDYGWQGFEKVFAIEDGRLVLERFKPLLVDHTTVQVDKHSGEFRGFKQHAEEIPAEKCLRFTYDQEGDNYYGRARLESIRKVWSWWVDANKAAAKYDRKVAGAQLVVHAPPGTSQNEAGQERPNHEIASLLIKRLEAAEGVFVPNEYAGDTDSRDVERAEKRRWILEILEDKGARQPGFDVRLRYLDALKFRGMLRPERTALEANKGGIGTSDTNDVQDVSLTDGELLDQWIARTINRDVIDQLLVLNFGAAARGTVYIKPAPLRDELKGFYRDLIKALVANPAGFELLLQWFDWDAIADVLGVPKAQEVIDPAGITFPMPGVDPASPEAERMRVLMEKAAPGSAPGSAPSPGGAPAPGAMPPAGGPEQSSAMATNDLRATVGGSTAIRELQMAYYERKLPRDAAIANASIVFGFTAEESAALFPELPPDAPKDPDAPEPGAAVAAATGGEEDAGAGGPPTGTVKLALGAGAGRWVTINGARVLIEDGKISKGPKGLVGKSPDEIGRADRERRAGSADRRAPGGTDRAAGGGPSTAANRKKGAAPPVKDFFAPPPPTGGPGRKAGGFTATGATNTSLGDLAENKIGKLGFRSILPDGKRQNPLDTEWDHSGYAFEVKAVTTSSTEYKVKMKGHEAASKREYARRKGLKAGTMIVVMDTRRKRAHAYWREGIGNFRLTPGGQGWNYAGSVEY